MYLATVWNGCMTTPAVWGLSANSSTSRLELKLRGLSLWLVRVRLTRSVRIAAERSLLWTSVGDEAAAVLCQCQIAWIMPREWLVDDGGPGWPPSKRRAAALEASAQCICMRSTGDMIMSHIRVLVTSWAAFWIDWRRSISNIEHTRYSSLPSITILLSVHICTSS